MRILVGELTSISEDLVKMKERNDIEILKPGNTFPSARSTNKSSDIVGFEDKKVRIINKLIGSSSEVLIVAVIGIRGLGKTTLARKIYDDPDIASHYAIRAWATVSQDFHEREVLKCLLHSIRGLNHESSQESVEKLAENLYKSLKDKIYLIVMDDVWAREVVLKVESLLPRDSNGRRILLTSRFHYVGIKADHNSIIEYPIWFLSASKSWELLQDVVFDKEGCPPELEGLGKMIVNRCKGLPLLLILICGVLYKAERTLDYWKYVAEHIRFESDYLPNFASFCYNQLPHHLRACFLYMGVLPDYHEIRRSKLIKLWVANRFIKPNRSKSLEEVAKKYLKDLTDRKLIMVLEWTDSGEIKTCCIHDVLRDFCQMKTEEKFKSDLQKYLLQLEIRDNNSDVEYLLEVHDNLRHFSILTYL